jgi:hypothetical protein
MTRGGKLMAEHGPLATKFSEHVAKLFTGGADEAGALFAEDAVWDSTAGRLEGRDAVMAGLAGIRDSAGSLKHEVLEASDAESYMTILARNHYADGRQSVVGGAAQFNAYGKISHIMTLGRLPG